MAADAAMLLPLAVLLRFCLAAPPHRFGIWQPPKARPRARDPVFAAADGGGAVAARHRRAPAWQPAVDGAGERHQCQEVINQPSSTAHVSHNGLQGHVSATVDRHVGLKKETKGYELEIHHFKSL